MDQFVMPAFREFAEQIARDYLAIEQHAVQEEQSGNTRNAAALRREGRRWKKIMDKNGITICA